MDEFVLVLDEEELEYERSCRGSPLDEDDDEELVSEYEDLLCLKRIEAPPRTSVVNTFAEESRWYRRSERDLRPSLYTIELQCLSVKYILHNLVRSPRGKKFPEMQNELNATQSNGTVLVEIPRTRLTETIQQLQEMFPNLNTAIIDRAVLTSEADLRKATEKLLQISSKFS